MQNPDKKTPIFSLGLDFYDLIELSEFQLQAFLTLTPREEIVDWLKWNDPNGIYDDIQSLEEVGEILTKEEGIRIIKSQILEIG